MTPYCIMSIMSRIKFDIITIFPKIFDSYFSESIIKRAQEKKKVEIKIHNLRDFSLGKKHHKVDDRPFGGGPGMVLMAEPILRAFQKIKLSGLASKSKIILLSAGGKKFNQKMASAWAKKYKVIILICGRYEGIDERIKPAIKDLGFSIEEISIGNYVLTGGELPAMVVVDAVSRHIPGILGKSESIEENRLGVGVPMYTRPEILKWLGKKYSVPKILLSGDHKRIEEFRRKKRKAHR